MAHEQLTVLLPTHYDRARYVERLLAYLAGAGLRSRVLVADSSSGDRSAIRAAVSQARDSFPCDHLDFSPTIPMYRKIHEALAAVRSPLVVLLADDDFIVPRTLESAAQRLVDDSTVSTAHGEAMALAVTHGPGIDPLTTLRSRTRRNLVAEQAEPLERVAHYLRNYASIFYSVSRTQQARHSYRILSDLAPDYDFGQTLAGCLALAFGKAVLVPGMYYVVIESAISTSRGSSDVMVGWRKLLTSPTYSTRYGQFKAAILDAAQTALPRPDAERLIDSAFVDFLVDRLTSRRIGEVERLQRAASVARESLSRLSAVSGQAVRSVLQDPRRLVDFQAPRAAMAAFAKELDPMSLSALQQGGEATHIDRVLSAIRSYPGS